MNAKIMGWLIIYLTTSFISFAQDGTSISGCAGDSIQFHSSLKYYSIYTWDFGNNIYSYEEYPIIAFSQAGVYNVSVTAHDACCPDHDTIQIFQLTVYNDVNCTMQHEDSIISITPNPSSSNIAVNYFVYYNNNVAVDLRIIEVNTNLVKYVEQLSSINDITIIDVESLPVGNYLVGLFVGGILMNQKQLIIN